MPVPLGDVFRDFAFRDFAEVTVKPRCQPQHGLEWESGNALVRILASRACISDWSKRRNVYV